MSQSQHRMPKADCAEFPYIVTWREDSLLHWEDPWRFGLKDRNNQEILPCKFMWITLEREFQDSCYLQLHRVIIRENDEEYALDLKTKQQTKLFDRMMFSDGWLFGVDSLGWVVFDKELNQIGQYHSGLPCPLLEDFMFHPESMDYEEAWLIREEVKAHNLMEYGFSQNPNIFGFGRRQSTEYRRYHNSWYDLDSFGLVNIATDQCTEAIYSQISAFYFENELFYWGVTIEKSEYFYDPNGKSYDLNSGFVDIYSGDLKKINSYRFNKTKDLVRRLHDKSEIQIYGQDNLFDDPLIFLRSDDGKLGALDTRGELIVPFNYDSIQSHFHQNGENQYSLWKDGTKTQFTTIGNRLYCGWYSNTPVKHPDKLIIQYYSSSKFLNLADIDGQIIVDSCSLIEKVDPFNESVIPYLKPKENLLTKETFYLIVRDSIYYIYQNQHLLKVDSTNFTFDSPLKGVHNGFITPSGKIFLTYPNMESIGRLFSGKRNNTTYLFSIDGKKMMGFENCEKIHITHKNQVTVKFENGSERIFDTEKWDWKE